MSTLLIPNKDIIVPGAADVQKLLRQDFETIERYVNGLKSTTVAVQGDAKLSGDITLIPGTGITLTESGQDITIAATPDGTVPNGSTLNPTPSGQDYRIAFLLERPTSADNLFYIGPESSATATNVVWDIPPANSNPSGVKITLPGGSGNTWLVYPGIHYDSVSDDLVIHYYNVSSHHQFGMYARATFALVTTAGSPNSSIWGVWVSNGYLFVAANAGSGNVTVYYWQIGVSAAWSNWVATVPIGGGAYVYGVDQANNVAYVVSGTLGVYKLDLAAQTVTNLSAAAIPGSGTVRQISVVGTTLYLWYAQDGGSGAPLAYMFDLGTNTWLSGSIGGGALPSGYNNVSNPGYIDSIASWQYFAFSDTTKQSLPQVMPLAGPYWGSVAPVPLVSGTIYQNVLTVPVMVYQGVAYAPTAGAAAKNQIALGSSTPPPNLGSPHTYPAGGNDITRLESIFVPINWYYSMTLTNAAMSGVSTLIGV